MPTLVNGDTLSLNALGNATGVSTKSLSAAKGSTTGPISMSSFSLDSVDSISGYTYVVENTNETYRVLMSGVGSNFNRIATRGSNFQWTGGSTIVLSTNNGETAVFSASDMNPESPGTQTTLQTVISNSVCCKLIDTYNTHIPSYNTNRCKTVYSVDTYASNAYPLCITVDSDIMLSNGSTMKANDLVEGLLLKGYVVGGLPDESDGDYLSWSSDNLNLTPKDVKIVNLTYSFTNKYYSINDGEVKATDEHPMLVNDISTNTYKFKKMVELEIGDKLIHSNLGDINEIIINKIDIIDVNTEVVSIDVEEEDVYLVNGYITHNKGGDTHTDNQPPSAPTGLAYSSGNLSWNYASFDYHDIEVSANSSFTSLIYTSYNYQNTSILITTTNPGTTYYARVKGYKGGLPSAWSTTLTFVAVQPCASYSLPGMGYYYESSTACQYAYSFPVSGLFVDTMYFMSATKLYADSNCNIRTQSGYYSDGMYWRYWGGSSDPFFGSQGTCGA